MRRPIFAALLFALAAATAVRADELPPRPVTPTLTPVGLAPTNLLNQVIHGSAPLGTTVALYTNPVCGGPPVVSAPAETLVSTGIALAVPPDATTSYYATATDSFAQSSSCSAPGVTFVTDVTPPGTQIAIRTKSKTKRRTITFSFTTTEHELSPTFQCQLDGRPWLTCHSKHTITVKRGRHTFAVRAVDRAGNVDVTPATYRWRAV
jgi:hypothetical protein